MYKLKKLLIIIQRKILLLNRTRNFFRKSSFNSNFGQMLETQPTHKAYSPCALLTSRGKENHYNMSGSGDYFAIIYAVTYLYY